VKRSWQTARGRPANCTACRSPSKEALNVAGLHTTWGNPAFRDNVADWDATVVARLRRAGAIIVGKTNPHCMLADFAQTFNDV
jgi:amidase